MSDAIGLTTVPVPAPAAATDVVGDMGLQRIGAFLQAAINRMGNTAWRTRGGGATRNVVEHVFYNNPELLFDDQRLPALYLWRSTYRPQRFTDGDIKITSRVTLYWIREPAQPEIEAVRAPFEHSVNLMIERALFRERDAAWVVSGDTDALAATQGSHLPTWIGASQILKAEGNELALTKVISDADGERPTTFYGLATGLDVEEYSVWDPTLNTYPAALDLGLRQSGRHAGDIYEPSGNVVIFRGETLRRSGVSVTR
jgi:hypothetical protein